MMSPARLVVTMTSNWAGSLTIWWATLSMIRCCALDLRILGRHLLEDALEQALGELEDVGLGGAGDLRSALPAAPARRRSG